MTPDGKSVYVFVVWSFLLFGLFGCFFFAVWSVACSFFCCLGGGPGPAQTAKKTTRPRPNSKKKKAPASSGRVFFCCLGGWVCLFFAVWAGERVLFFAVWAGGRVLFFAVWAEACFFLLFGPGACVFFLLFGVHSLTGLPGSSFSDPITKKDQTAKKKKTRVPTPDPSLLSGFARGVLLSLHVRGWLSKLWSLFGYPKYEVPYYNRDPKKGP